MHQHKIIKKPLSWQFGTVQQSHVETHRVKTFTIGLPNWSGFRPGQHVDLRLTAPDGYQAQRSYSIASAPGKEDEIDLTIEFIPDGEVSPFFHEVVQPGDQIEIRGPIGGPFTWMTSMGGPLLLVAGGSGIVPLMSMLRHRSNTDPKIPALLLYSSRSLEEVIYRQELETAVAADLNLTVLHTLTRVQPDGWTGLRRRVDSEMLSQAMRRLGEPSHAYVCGPTGFVEVVADGLVDAGVDPATIHTERFGPSGK
jgi:ferredoxin-NADP reductase